MRLKWYFRNDPTPDFSEKPSFTPKSSWKPPTGHPNLEVFLSELEKQIFKIVDSKLGYSNFSKEEWQAMQTLADDRSIFIKKADKGSTVVVWDRNDYILEAENNLAMQMSTRIFPLMKRFCRNMWEQVRASSKHKRLSWSYH